MTKEIELTQGYITLVDDEDFEELNKHSWYIKRSANIVYAMSKINKKPTLMHRLLMKFPEGMCVDHINHNGIDNRKCNLRICTVAQNAMNTKK
jgi:hypothetical protein